MTENIDENIVDFLDLINFTLSNKFEEKWKHRFSSPFIKLFQLKLLERCRVKDAGSIQKRKQFQEMRKIILLY